MSAISESICWCCDGKGRIERQERTAVGTGQPVAPGELLERYRQADQAARLCLWLEHRERRRDMDELERHWPAKPADGWGRVRRWLGLPGI